MTTKILIILIRIQEHIYPLSRLWRALSARHILCHAWDLIKGIVGFALQSVQNNLNLDLI